MSHGARKPTLSGWMWWLPVLLIPFVALAVDTWLNTATTNLDYEAVEINRRLRELNETLDAQRVEQARLITIDRIALQAPDLGLIKPEPNQIQIVYHTEPGLLPGPETSYALARLP